MVSRFHAESVATTQRGRSRGMAVGLAFLSDLPVLSLALRQSLAEVNHAIIDVT